MSKNAFCCPVWRYYRAECSHCEMYNQLVAKSHFRFLLQTPKHLSLISHFHSSNQIPTPQSKLDFMLEQVEELQSLKPPQHDQTSAQKPPQEATIPNGYSSFEPPEVKISHPWPEWIDLMELLLKKGLFQEGSASYGHTFGEEALGNKERNRVRTACLNFARQRSDLIRYFSRKDIRVMMESGCPSIDRKVVNSGKRLRAHVGTDEGKVCSVCSLRGGCERAYVMAHEDEGGRTIDVMRILLTYGLNHYTSSVENKLCLNRRVKESVQKLLRQMVEFSVRELSSDSPKAIPSRRTSSKPEHSAPQQIGQINVPMKQGDWMCPKCDFLNFAKNIKCLRCNGLFKDRLRKLGEDQDHLPLKKGDWLCDICNFLNFAKNTRCLQCEEKPPNRHLNPGEWECESCNYINFRKNMVCLKCDWKRPKASNYTGSSAQPQNENRGFGQSRGMNFVRDGGEDNDQLYVRQDRQSRKEGAHLLRYTEEGWDDGDDDLCPEKRFGDFPIVGGKSKVSQNSQARERWKREMSEKGRFASKECEDHGSSDIKLPKNLECLECNDEEMAGWFGYRNNSGET